MWAHALRTLVAEDHLPASLVSDMRTFQWDMWTLRWTGRGPPDAVEATDARRAGTVHVADDFDNFTKFAAQIAWAGWPEAIHPLRATVPG